ncbi:MORN repeat-containing protein [Confluentibacter sediminis]|uniref:MORN repeat-containing protein n=1 Tax=Confluentibacter sediminis TaxID=2219045 RepID=UPI000DAC8A79|nr:hypothetical protein [Confluentibacter sediminis]
MKRLILLLIILFSSIDTFAQKVDLVNAPENPIVLKFKLEHFNLKGDVYCYNSQYYFNKEGLLTSKSDYQGDNTYSYKNGKLDWKWGLNDQGYITELNGHVYTYNDKWLLISDTQIIPEKYNQPQQSKTKKYTYDLQNRLIKQEAYESDVLKSSTTFKYAKEGTILKVFSTETEASKTLLSEKRYKDGRLIYSKSNSDNIELKIESKLDGKGNSIEDKHINGGELTDTFNYSIVYYSDANKPLDYKIVIKKDANGNLYQHIYRNGTYFYSPLKTQLEGSNDLLFYDDLTQNYYIAKDAYNKTLTNGFTIKMELIAKDSEVLLKNLPENRVVVFYQGKNVFLNSKKSVSFYILNYLFSYHVDKNNSEEKTFFFKDAKEKTFAPGILLPENKDQFYYYLDGETNKVLMVLKGVSINNTSFSNRVKFGDYGLLAYVNNVPTYVFPDYYNMEKDKMYLARMYDEKTDAETLNNTKQTSTNTTSSNTNCLSGNCIDGYGELQTKESTLIGLFKNGKANGYGIQTYDKGVYMGNFKDGIRDGNGIYNWKDINQFYIGEWKQGKQHGFGYFITNQVITSAGYYENGAQVTNMFEPYRNKTISNGCQGNCNDGFGQLTYSDGTVVTGFFKNAFINGPASIVWKNQDIYIGNWNNNVREGQGMYIYKNTGEIYYGDFSNNNREGWGMYYDKNGNVLNRGIWANGNIKTSM